MSSHSSDSNINNALLLCSLFESEILVWLLLRYWDHPFSEDNEFRSTLLESATEFLQNAAASTDVVFIQGMPTQDMNFIAAIWYCETCSVSAMDAREENRDNLQSRKEWLKQLRHALPSCFCAQSDLTG